MACCALAVPQEGHRKTMQLQMLFSISLLDPSSLHGVLQRHAFTYSKIIIPSEQRDTAAIVFLAKLLAACRALADCPKSGILLAENLAMAPRPARKAKSLDALKECPDDPHVVAAVAQLIFWSDRKVRRCLSPHCPHSPGVSHALGHPMSDAKSNSTISMHALLV